MEEIVGGLHVGAVRPGAASAVEDDGFVARQLVDASAEALKGGGIGRRADVFGVGDVSLCVEDVGSDVDEERLFPFRRVQDFHEVVDHHRMRGSDLAGLEGEGGGDEYGCD